MRVCVCACWCDTQLSLSLYPGSKSKTLVLYPLRGLDREQQTGSNREERRNRWKGEERRDANVKTWRDMVMLAKGGERGTDNG